MRVEDPPNDPVRSALSIDDGRIRVLHVDDDAEFLALAGAFLEREDGRLDVQAADGAVAGLERLSADRFDCVVSDYDMPEMDGIAFLERVREDHPELPFVLFTGKGSEEVASEAISAGVTDYLQKGTATEQYALLANRVRNAVERSRSRRELAASQARLSLFVEQSPLGIIEYAPDETIVAVNPAAEEILGYSEAELVGASWDRLVPDEEASEVEAVARELRGATGGQYSVNENVRKDGQRIICAWHNRTVTDDDGDLVAAFSQFQDVTDHEETRRALERNQQRYRSLARQFPEGGVFVFDADCRYVLAGGSGLAAVGLTPEGMHGNRPRDLFDPSVAEAVEASYRRALAGEHQVYEQEFRGEHYRVHVLPLATDDDAVSEGMVVSHNITEQVIHERQLATLRERSQALMYTEDRTETARVAANIAADIIDAPLSGVHLVDEAGETLGPGALVDGAFEVFEEPPVYHRDAAAGTRDALIWAVFTDGEPLLVDDFDAHDPLEEATPAGSGLVYPLGEHGVFVVSSPETGAFDETDCSLAEILATTLTTALDRLASEAGLREREAALGGLHDATRRLVAADTTAEIAAELSVVAEDVLGFSIVSVRLYDEEREALVPTATTDSTEATLPSREAFTAEGGSLNWRAFAAGERRYYGDIRSVEGAVDVETGLRSLMVFPLARHGTIAVGETTPDAFDENDRFLAGILATAGETALDAVARNTELRDQRNALRRQNERLEEFASVVSHDLRNPLSVLDGSLDILGTADDHDDEHVTRARRAVDRMDALIEDLLALSRAGVGIDTLEPVDIDGIARASWATADTGAATLVVETGRVVLADRSRLQQALENLFRNSTEHGGDGVTVTVSATADGFVVADDGPGIPPDERDRALESGYSTASNGTGFGLAIVEQVAHAHGWTLSLGEREAGGLRVVFSGVDAPPVDPDVAWRVD